MGGRGGDAGAEQLPQRRWGRHCGGPIGPALLKRDYIRVTVILVVEFSSVTLPSPAGFLKVPVPGQTLLGPSWATRFAEFLPEMGLRVSIAPPAPTVARPLILSVSLP